MKAKREDFELERPQSLRDILIDEIHATNYDDFEEGKPVKRLDDETIEELLTRIYEHIERQALAIYRTNEPWALKAWAYANILKDVVGSDETEGMVSELMSPVFDWQNKQEFDPISHFKAKMERERKSDRTKEAYMQTASRFVARIGRRGNYTDEEIEEYLTWAEKRYPKETSSYQHECARLLQFMRGLPGGKNRELPFEVPKMPKKLHQPMFSFEDIELLIWATVIDNTEGEIVARLAAGTVYGARLGEAAQLNSGDIYLDGANSTIMLRTEKEGELKAQPIPQQLVPLFAIPIEPITSNRLLKDLKELCKAVGVRQPHHGSFHAIRRRVVTEIAEIEHSDINVHRFMRWAEPRQYAILATYKKNPSEVTDKEILSRHPFVKVWEEVMPYLLHNNPSYGLMNNT